MAAALLHDVGHGPFSHATESVIGDIAPDLPDHETWTAHVITADTAVHDVLTSYDARLPRRVTQLLRGGPSLTSGEQTLHGLLAGNFDVDRLDFLVRDSVHVGLRTGLVDVARLLDGLVVQDSTILVMEKNLTTVEEFLLARRFMYQKVYFHKTTRGMEAVYRSWLLRWRDTADMLPDEVSASAIGGLVRGQTNMQEFLTLDDTDVVTAAKRLIKWDGDRILSRLSAALLWRKPFKVAAEWEDGQRPVALAKRRNAESYLEGAGFPCDYYYVEDYSSEVAYQLVPYGSDASTSIQVQRRGDVKDIAECSSIVRDLMHVAERTRVYVPWQRRRKVQEILAG